MLNRLRLLTVLAVIIPPCLGQQALLKADANPTAEAEIKDVESQLAKLVIQGKWDEYASRLSDDYVQTGGKAEMKTKPAVMAEFRSGKSLVLDMIPEELQARVYGDAAILTGHLSVLARENGRVTTTFSRFTNTFIKRDGRWFLSASQETRVLK